MSSLKLFGRITIITLLLMVLLSQFVYAQHDGGVYVIPVEGEITPALSNFVKDSIDLAHDNSAQAIILEINTPGGLVDSAIDIKDAVFDSTIPVITYVNKRASSAGALISLAGDNMYMAPGSTIGSAETLPKDEKIISDWTSQLRSTAASRGKDGDIAAAMADKDIEIPGVIDKGRLLNLTAQRALELSMCDGIADNINDVLTMTDLEDQSLVRIQPDFRHNFARMLTSNFVAPILLAIGIIAIIVEIFTAGFGAGGTIAIIAFSLFFWSNITAGNADWGTVILFIAGVILLIIEATIPGFGVVGIGGIICIVISIILASPSPAAGLITILVSFGLTAVILPIIFKYAPKSKLFERIVLTVQQRKEAGYISSYDKSTDLIGKTGIALTNLRPAGIALLDGKRIDVVSNGGFITMNTKIKVIKIEGIRIVVEKINN
ncbi:MAG TPA: nodulation protein NfeD [Clostridiales bacterium]|nr:nodulation protein NfeD [Clostridiales bacterium]